MVLAVHAHRDRPGVPGDSKTDDNVMEMHYKKLLLEGKPSRVPFTYDVCTERGYSRRCQVPYLNDVFTIFDILDPLPPLVYILVRSIVLNPSNDPFYLCISVTPSQSTRHLSMAPYKKA